MNEPISFDEKIAFLHKLTEQRAQDYVEFRDLIQGKMDEITAELGHLDFHLSEFDDALLEIWTADERSRIVNALKNFGMEISE